MTISVTLVGYVFDCPVLSDVPGGEPMTTFRLAVGRDDPKLLDVECRGALAENVAASLRCSLRVVVVGSLRAASCSPDAEGVVAAVEVAPSLHWATAVVAFRAPIYPPQPPVALRLARGAAEPPLACTGREVAA